MAEALPTLGVSHVRHAATVATPRSVRHSHHLVHVAFNNRIEASEKRIDGRPVRAHVGRTVGRSMILPAGSELWGWATGELDFLRLEIDALAVVSATEDAGCRGPIVLRPQIQLDNPVLWHLACALRADMAMGQPGGQLFRDSAAGLIASHLATIHLGGVGPLQVASGALSIVQFRRVREFMRQNLHSDLRLAEMADTVGLSTFHFARAFKAVAGTSPSRFLLEERLAMARRLLEATDVGVGEIARSAGFGSVTGFGAAFRRRFGIPPSHYRRIVQG